MSPHLLIVAYHFPPIQASSGLHRPLAFARYLLSAGWRVTVLTAAERAYEKTYPENIRLIPEGASVIRANAWDTSRHLSVAGRYPRWLALPDRWQSWIPFALLAGASAARKDPFDAVLSTFPLASAHVIGLGLKRLLNKPWIADFRDPMAQDAYPVDVRIRQLYFRLERRIFDRADRVTVTTRGTAEYYEARYRELARNKLSVIENGFDPETMNGSTQQSPEASDPRRKLVLLHSGLLYPKDRDPETFLRALAQLVKNGEISDSAIEVRFRASGYEDHHRALIEKYGLASLVKLLPSVPYAEAHAEMMSADGLLLFQASSCNRQIPAKAYEYLWAARPVIGITDPQGDTGRLLSSMDIPAIAALEDEASVLDVVTRALRQIRSGEYFVPDRARVMSLSRQHRAAELKALLEQLVKR
jgi:glycosyltransferase involved in cell wall biosynthesis